MAEPSLSQASTPTPRGARARGNEAPTPLAAPSGVGNGTAVTRHRIEGVERTCTVPLMEGHLDAVIEARDEVSALIRAKQAERAALDDEIASLTTEVEGLNLYIRRHGVPVMTVSPDEAAQWREMTRTGAIITVLQEMKRPGSPKEISEWLRNTGREDDPADISRALNRLKEQHRVISQGRGLWAPSDTPGQDAEASTEPDPGDVEQDLSTGEQLSTNGQQPDVADFNFPG